MEELLKNGADTNEATKDGKTATEVAEESNDDEIANIIEENMLAKEEKKTKKNSKRGIMEMLNKKI